MAHCIFQKKKKKGKKEKKKNQIVSLPIPFLLAFWLVKKKEEVVVNSHLMSLKTGALR